MNRQHRTNSVLTIAAVAMVSLVLTAGSAWADLLVYEPFAYPDGNLTGQGGALGTTGTWASHDTNSPSWHVHPEGDTSGIVVDPGPPIARNAFDGTVANLPTSGGYAGLPGPADTGADLDLDHEIGRHMNASIALDPAVTATFTSGTTTWFSFVSARGWDRNEQGAQLMISTDSSANENRAISLSNSGNGIGGGGGSPRNNRTDIMPQYFSGGVVANALGTGGGGFNDLTELPDATHTMPWDEFNPDGSFGPPLIVVGKIEWDADTGGEDIISVARFLETDTLNEAAFDALIGLKPGLSSANWDDANKPDLDQSQFDTINLSGTKFFVDEIRIATTFAEALGVPEPSTLVLAVFGLLGLMGIRRRGRK